MELALVDCLAFCCIYIDDILVFSSNPEAHVNDKLANYVILHVPLPSDKFVVHVDSSHLGIGAVLNVLREDQELQVAFFSSKIGDAQKNYSATEFEVYGVLRAVKHYHYYLVNQLFTVVADH